MTIELYTGYLGSGKSYHATAEACRVADAPHGKLWVFANFPIKKKKKLLHFLHKGEKKYTEPRWLYKDNEDLTPEFLMRESIKRGWDKIKTVSCLLIFDEASIIFNSRDWQKSSRGDWIKFLQHSRKFGYDVILITQDSRMIDRQIRNLVEYEYVHRQLNNHALFGWLKMLKITIFVSLKYWNGIKYSRATMKLTRYKKSIGERYDTKALFGVADELQEDIQEDISIKRIEG